MKINLLAVTHDQELLASLAALYCNGEAILVTPAGTIEQLQNIIGQKQYKAALIDTVGSSTPPNQMIADLVRRQPGIRLMVLNGDEDETPLLNQTTDYRLLSRPFNIEEMIGALKDMLVASEPSSDVDEPVVLQTGDEPEPSLIEIIDAVVFESATTEPIQDNSDYPPVIETDLRNDLEITLVETETSTLETTSTLPPEVNALRLSYCCVLVPRHPRQYLARELAARAASILPQLHLSRGWRVTGISVRPQYLQWTLSLPLDCCPVEAIREIRQRTSAYFFAQFPDLAPTGQTRDFWAKGYLMMSGAHPLPPSIIGEFIQHAHTASTR